MHTVAMVVEARPGGVGALVVGATVVVGVAAGGGRDGGGRPGRGRQRGGSACPPKYGSRAMRTKPSMDAASCRPPIAAPTMVEQHDRTDP